MIAHEIRYAAAAVVCFSVTVGLGLLTREPRTLPLDATAERFFFGHGTTLAWIFTVTGYGRTLGACYVAVFALALGFHRAIVELSALALTQIVSQFAARRLKLFFNRLRPANWLIKHEHDSSFPSGHATTAAVSFAGIVLLLWRSSLPYEIRAAATVLPAIFALGIGWSRMVLGAHYLTDVLGGYAFGTAWIFTMVALLEAYGV